MGGGRIKSIAAVFMGGRAAGVGAALREAVPLEDEADAAMKRCLDQLDNIETSIKGRLKHGDSAKD